MLTNSNIDGKICGKLMVIVTMENNYNEMEIIMVITMATIIMRMRMKVIVLMEIMTLVE